MKPKKLIIWDFDGVIADSEYLWVGNWLHTLRQLKNLELDEQQTEYYIRGRADKTKIERLQKDYPDLVFDDTFAQTLFENEVKLINSKLEITPDVEQILQDGNFAHCIATGANKIKNTLKIQKLKLEKYFNKDNVFTAYDVKNGKPAPDLFLYAAQKMGYHPQDCIIIEDSLVGIRAGIASGIPVIAYIGATGNNTPEYAAKCTELGVQYIVKTMRQAHEILKNFYNE